MFTPIEKHEIHCAKRYLDYTENEFFRAFRDRQNQTCYACNYAVLKSTQNAGETFERVERFFAGMDDTVPKFYAKPDSVSLLQAKAAFERYGYAVKAIQEMRMEMKALPDPSLKILPIEIKMFDSYTPLGIQECAFIDTAAGGLPYALLMAKKQLGAGAKAFFAYNKAGVCVSYCLGEGYGSAFYISDVFTPQPCRKQGCATSVLAAALRHAQETGYAHVYLDVENPAAQRLYERLGFRGVPHTTYCAFKGGLPPEMGGEA